MTENRTLKDDDFETRLADAAKAVLRQSPYRDLVGCEWMRTKRRRKPRRPGLAPVIPFRRPRVA